MNKPEEITGPADMATPYGYVDVTSIHDKVGRRFIPGADHPYYMRLDRIVSVIRATEAFTHATTCMCCPRINASQLASQIMEAM